MTEEDDKLSCAFRDAERYASVKGIGRADILVECGHGFYHVIGTDAEAESFRRDRVDIESAD